MVNGTGILFIMTEDEDFSYVITQNMLLNQTIDIDLIRDIEINLTLDFTEQMIAICNRISGELNSTLQYKDQYESCLVASKTCHEKQEDLIKDGVTRGNLTSCTTNLQGLKTQVSTKNTEVSTLNKELEDEKQKNSSSTWWKILIGAAGMYAVGHYMKKEKLPKATEAEELGGEE